MTATIKSLLLGQMQINARLANLKTEPEVLPELTEVLTEPIEVLPTVKREGINANTATADELAALPRLGASRAQMIIAGRPWDKVESISKRVRGISERMIKDWKMYCE